MYLKKITLTILILSFMQLTAFYFGKNKIQNTKINWSKIETLHFDIYFEKGKEEFGKIAALISEEAYYYIREDFKTPIKDRIPIIFYGSHQKFESTNIISPLLNEYVGGFTESGKNRVVIPFDGSYCKMEKVLIHELTHAYVNAVNKRKLGIFDISPFPFWFQEGLPEFEAVGGKSIYNNMFILDMIMNDGLIDLNRAGSYFAYREGESFLTFISREYGREFVIELFYAVRIATTIDAATQKVFGCDFRELQMKWKNYLKRKYFPYINNFDVPYEKFTRLTDHTKDGSLMNYAPKFSPNSEQFLYFSDKNLRTDIWLGSLLKVVPNKMILKGGATPKFEEFHFQRNNFSWFPEGDKFAFVAKTADGDKIYIIDSQTRKTVDILSFSDFEAIYEIDISRDGKKLVFSAQKELQNDIFTFQFEGDEIDQITDDRYFDFQPCWSPDGSKIAFASERFSNDENGNGFVFDKLTSDIFYFDYEKNKFFIVTEDRFNNDFPIWDNSGEKLLFLSERDSIKNFEMIDLDEGKRAIITRSLGGINFGDINAENDMMVFSCYYDQGWDLYTLNDPLENLVFEEYSKPLEYSLADDFYENFEIDRYKYFGKDDRKFKKELPRNLMDKKITTFDFASRIKEDSLNVKYNLRIDEKPTKINEPQIKPYKTKFSIDGFWGGMAYSPSGGTYGQVSLSLSDLMGNHVIGIEAGLNSQLKDSDLVLNYLNLSNRIDYGFGGFYLNYESVYYENTYDFFYRVREREYGIYSILRYPFNKFWRLDLENIFYKDVIRFDLWDDSNNVWLDDELGSEDNLTFAPQLNMVHDNTIYGNVGPISGWRGAVIVNRNFSKGYTYSLFYMDLRNYLFFAKKYSFAFRLVGGSTFLGDSYSKFRFDYGNDVRGFDEEIEGDKKVLTSLEFRFPFIDNFKFDFPLPLWFNNIRGSAFLDAGCLWNDNADLKISEDGVLNDLKIGFGTGPRLNLGYFVLKFDIAWNTDLENVSKPVYYISLSENF